MKGSFREADSRVDAIFINTSAFLDTNPTDELITSGLLVIREQLEFVRLSMPICRIPVSRSPRHIGLVRNHTIASVTPANRHALRQCSWAFIRLAGGHQSAETGSSSPPYDASRRFVLLERCGIQVLAP